MRCLFLIIACAAFQQGFSQTKMIAFKSHSGSDENFSVALEQNLFDMEDGNFGLPPNSYLDSVILLKDSVAVLVKKESKRSAYSERDTIKGHPLLAKSVSKDSLKKSLRQLTWFNNPVESVNFEGFDQKKKKGKRKNNLVPAGGFSGNDQAPFGGQVIVIATGILLLSLLAGLLAWKLKPAMVMQAA